MIVKRKDKESNYALVRRFNRDLIVDSKLTRVKERQFFTKPMTRRQVRQAAIMREKLRKQYQTY